MRREGVPDVLRPDPYFEDPWDRIIDLWWIKVKEVDLDFLILFQPV